jgi:hypothetical protein
MKAFDEGYRLMAASCFTEADGDTTAAAKDFVTRLENLGAKAPRAARDYVSRWGQYWATHGHVKGDSHNSGRKRKLPDEDAAQLASDLKNWRQFELQGPFVSIRQLRRTSPRSQQILQAAAAAHSTVTRALQRVAPELVYSQLDIKQKLTARQKRARYETAQHHSTVSDNTLECVVWIDAKVIYCTIRTRSGWVVHEEAVPFETKRPGSKKKPTQLRYYIGVCARAGKVFLKFVTGTTGFTPDRTYMVSGTASSGDVQRRLLVGSRMLHSQLNDSAPALTAPTVGTRYQPHYLKTLLYGPRCQCPIPSCHNCTVIQASAATVFTSVWLIIMLLPLYCNQNPGRL